LFNVFKSLKWQTLAAGVDDEDKWICWWVMFFLSAKVSLSMSLPWP
jgi:hypothetical protein